MLSFEGHQMARAESPLLIDRERCQSSSSASLDTLIRDLASPDDASASFPSDMDWLGDGIVEVGITPAGAPFEAPPPSAFRGSWGLNPDDPGAGQNVPSGTWWPSTDQDLQNLCREANQPVRISRDRRPMRYVSDDLLPELPDDFPTFLPDEPEISSGQQRTPGPSKKDTRAGLSYCELSASTSTTFSADDMDCSFPAASLPASSSLLAVPDPRALVKGFGPSTMPQVHERPGTAVNTVWRPNTTAVRFCSEAVAPNARHAAAAPGAVSATATAAAMMSMLGAGKCRPTPSQARVPEQPLQQKRPSVFQTRPPQAVLKVNQVALAAALQKAGCGTAATVRSLDEELIALIISSRAELQVFLTALGLNHLAVADWKLVATGLGAAQVECPPEMGPDEHVRGLQLLERLMRMRSRLCRELDQQLRTLLGMPGVLEVTEDAQEAGAAGHSGQAAVPRMLPAPPKVSRAQRSVDAHAVSMLGLRHRLEHGFAYFLREHTMVLWCEVNYDKPYPDKERKAALGAYAQKDKRQVNDWFTNWRARTWKKDILRSMHWSRVGAKVLALVHFMRRCQEAEQRRLPAVKQEFGTGTGRKGSASDPCPSPGVAVRVALERWGPQKGLKR